MNLQTVNYILHGIQHYKDTEAGWRDSFWRGFGLDLLDARAWQDAEMLCTHVVRQCMTPFGVVVSEVSHSSDQAVAMVVDGRVERGVRNYWGVRIGGEHEGAVEMPQPGDELVLVLERVEKKLDEGSHQWEKELEKWAYVLPNHVGHYGSERAVFPIKRARLAAGVAGSVEEEKQWIWQLVPRVLANCLLGENVSRRGYWRIGAVY